MKLTPTQKALISSILLPALVAGGVAIEPILSATGPIDWQLVAITFAVVAIANLAHNVVVSIEPSQPILASESEALLTLVEKRYGLTPIPVPQNSPTMPVATPPVSGYSNVQTIGVPVSTPTVAPNSGTIWAPLQGGDVSTQTTASQPVVQPKQ